MKKINRIKLDETVLSPNELKQLKGGRDVVNSNRSHTCSCTFYNAPSATSNQNDVIGCSCTCTY
ncbi:hypothetical protein [Dysgonomonas sp. ZJ279]|uniref:hypothetical protein n=1 Tax=Dysgonomonas sp. ZJ279 TaxID=2709796 RepID=UPI0013EE2192|nr:hypothetical protein [Dysgonomonas sp. ZJ279]